MDNDSSATGETNREEPLISAETAHRMRVILELSELSGKSAKLENFILKNPIFETLPEQEQGLLKLQHVVMAEYEQILRARISGWSFPTDASAGSQAASPDAK